MFENYIARLLMSAELSLEIAAHRRDKTAISRAKREKAIAATASLILDSRGESDAAKYLDNSGFGM